jgi:hypothetical protein
MKKKLLFVFNILFISLLAHAQTSRTAVAVIGNGNTALAAGLQSAISGVQTTLILQSQDFSLSPIHTNLGSGLEVEFLKRMRKAKGLKDSTASVALDQATVSAVVKEWTDSTKNLTVIRSAKFYRFKRAGSGWNIQLSTGRTIKAKVLINADKTMPLTADVQVPATPTAGQWKTLDYGTSIYRTSVASEQGAAILPLHSLLLPEQENLVAVNTARESMASGQAAGATAAYAAFFGKKTSESHLKTIQGELLNYKLALMPFVDVPYTDANWKAIQFVGVMGVLKAEIKSGKAYFLPEQTVQTAEIKQPLKDLFYKAQIWFEDYKAAEMTLDGTIKLVSFVGNKSPASTVEDLKKKWEKNYKFKTAFDLTKVLNRREFASILQDYLPPFNVTVDAAGRITR